MRMNQSQIQAPILADLNALVADIIMHIQENAPDVAKAYPPGYLVQIVKHSTLIARDSFGLRVCRRSGFSWPCGGTSARGISSTRSFMPS